MYSHTLGDCISLLCSSPLNPTDYVTYTCYTGYVNSFLEWSVVDSSGNVIVDFVFSSSDEVGSKHFQDNFLGVLTDKTNGLTSILTFKATTDRNNSHVICGLKNTSCKKECKITIKGMCVYMHASMCNIDECSFKSNIIVKTDWSI